MKYSIWSTKPYCADIVNGLSVSRDLFFRVILSEISLNLNDFHSSSNPLNRNLIQVYYANEFEALGNDLIAAVGTYFSSSCEKYEISIYVNDILKHTQNGTSAFGGFSTVKLNNYIPVNKGDIFKAVIKGVNVPLSINTRVHNDDLATLNINLIPGKYIITAIKQVPGLDMRYGVTVLK